MRQKYEHTGTVNNYENCTFQQPGLPMEKRDRRQTIVFTESEEKELMRLARHYGYSQLSPFLRDMVFAGTKMAKYRNMTLADILS